MTSFTCTVVIDESFVFLCEEFPEWVREHGEGATLTIGEHFVKIVAADGIHTLYQPMVTERQCSNDRIRGWNGALMMAEQETGMSLRSLWREPLP